MGATDPRERALVAKQRMELAPLSPEDLAERRCVDLERIGTEMCELRVELRGRHEPHPGTPLLSRLGQQQLAAVAKRTWNIGFAGPFLPAGR